ncbi:SWIM zinc finger family protein [Pseudobacteroides cellulosolvens]|uniref:SWIM-type domain-containing protein n=1 Tax=Pseudobacteroides cellulosolvens ATCC 35603 = DSM 2933 TaxID=398512 RepID=A0A0L6JU98_9FIRM|nr:SWIM zinc finger family protein [Pseudobacteroides cellulosolvens]KNY29220.1 hypothetical protein Bccel_4494 [Pseudobacteroides cellulosolvens ATCC 35603 = DSM 2933]
MPKISVEFINQLAMNQKAISNGWALVKKKSFIRLNISEDDKVIFGECMEYGYDNFKASADFLNPENPVFKCSCPSRQYPCKHVLGLMYSYIENQQFNIDVIPLEILEERKKIDKKISKKRNKAVKTGEANELDLLVLKKKVQAQLDGLELFKKLRCSITRDGFKALNNHNLDLLDKQIKQLGNYYLSGPQYELMKFTYLFRDCKNHEKVYTEAITSISHMYALYKKGKEYLSTKLETCDFSMNTSTSIEDWLGHSWQLNELRTLGCVIKNAQIIQLSFDSICNKGKKEFIDNGIWLNLSSGQIYNTYNFRPLKAARHIREDDSIFKILKLEELFVYPGTDLNPRVRWEKSEIRDVNSGDLEKVKSFAKDSFDNVIKLIKNQIKNPLADKCPVVLVKYEKLGVIDDTFIIEDKSGQRLVLETSENKALPTGVRVLKFLNPDKLQNAVILLKFKHDFDTKKLFTIPLSVIIENEIVRLSF